jgi:hypothetical protein
MHVLELGERHSGLIYLPCIALGELGAAVPPRMPPDWENQPRLNHDAISADTPTWPTFSVTFCK